MTYGSLFSGIGGLDLALEAFGHTPLWQAERDPYALAVLAKHWPEVRRYNDVKEIDDAAERPDIICGGFPCQDISNAGKRVGIDGERSGLWSEFARIIRVLRPRFVFVENVAALAVRGLDRVLGDLATLGFDAEWDVLRAADVGAPHLRARIFILAYAQRADLWEQQGRIGWPGWPGEAQPGEHGVPWPLADAGGARRGDTEDAGANRSDEATLSCGRQESARREQSKRSSNVPDSNGGRLEVERWQERDGREAGVEDARGNVVDGCGGQISDSECNRLEGSEHARAGQRETAVRRRSADSDWWRVEPSVGRVAHGVSKRVDRLRCLGNAVVWQQAAFALETLSARSARKDTP